MRPSATPQAHNSRAAQTSRVSLDNIPVVPLKGCRPCGEYQAQSTNMYRCARSSLSLCNAFGTLIRLAKTRRYYVDISMRKRPPFWIRTEQFYAAKSRPRVFERDGLRCVCRRRPKWTRSFFRRAPCVRNDALFPISGQQIGAAVRLFPAIYAVLHVTDGRTDHVVVDARSDVVVLVQRVQRSEQAVFRGESLKRELYD